MAKQKQTVRRAKAKPPKASVAPPPNIPQPVSPAVRPAPMAAAEPSAGHACPACGSPDRRKLFSATDRLCRSTREQFEIVECAQCRLLRLYPWPRGSAEAREHRHSAVPDSRTAAGRLEILYQNIVLADPVKFVRRALAHSGGAGPVLDYSFDGGLFRDALAAEGIPVFGMSSSLEGAAGTRNGSSAPALCATVDAPAVAPESCAAATMFYVLEHLENPVDAVSSIRNLLRPGGSLILQAANCASWQFLMLRENWSGIDVPRHLVHFRPRDIETLLDCCGFEVVRRKHFSLRDNPAGLATSIAPWLDPDVRRARSVKEGPLAGLLKNSLYLGLAAAAVPFTVLEAACGAGSSVIYEARRK